MSDIYAIFGTLLALGIVFPGMLTAWWLLFPDTVSGAQERMATSPWKSLAAGLLGATPLAVVFGLLIALPVPFTKFVGAVGVVGMLAVASVGASGLASAMGARLAQRSTASEAACFVRGAVALALAAAFPFIGWFIVIPVVTVMGFGATLRTIMSGSRTAGNKSAEPSLSQA